MNADKLLDSIGMINEEYVEEACNPTPKLIRKKSVFKLALVAVIALLCISLIVPTFAVVVREPDKLLYAMFPSIAQKLKPVQMSCVDNGIKLEVISANVTDTEAQVYVSLQDLQGDRVDDTTDLFDSYNIRRPFDSNATCSMVSFDSETKTATFLIDIEWYNTRNVLGSKVTFSLDEFLSHKQEYEGYLEGIDLSQVGNATDTITDVSIRGGSYIDENQVLLDENSKYLKPLQSGIVESPVDGVQITGMGYINGKLHIQTYYNNILDYDNHGFVSIVDKYGNKDYGEQSIAFWDEDKVGSYEEGVFDISPEELADSRLYCYFVTTDTVTRGNWEVTFELG
ncbi:MAG: hypothetical protein IJ298_07735 [Ruminococcus sp.]|nr:hypothetical protein [Ruminococcus sp.]